jgi:hypothetical protein
MADEQQVPPSVDDSADRIQGRDYESNFARFPDHETQPVVEPGAGPYGTAATTNAPVVVMAIGALIAASVFVFNSPWVLGFGLAIFLGAAIWAGVANRGRGSAAGSGPSTIDSDETDRPQ